MLEVLISGKLIRDPTTKIGPSGKPYALALVLVPTEHEENLVASVIAFGDVAERLGRLKAGDAVSLAGSAKLSTWEKGGERHHGLNVTAAAILSAYDVRKRHGAGEGSSRNAGGRRQIERRSESIPPDDETPFDDPIGF